MRVSSRFFVISTIALIVFAAGVSAVWPPNTAYAVGDYCDGTRTVNQWSCDKLKQIDLCTYRNGIFRDECEQFPNPCYTVGGHCDVLTNRECKVLDTDASCNTDGCEDGVCACMTFDTYSDCSEGPTWKSNCVLASWETKPCWVLTYGCDSNDACVRDAVGGTYTDSTCNNECGGGGDRPIDSPAGTGYT